MEDREIYFVLASVVLVTRRNTPETFHEGWLEQNEIFDEGMEVEQALKTPPVTKIQFKNGLVFEAHKNPSDGGQGRTEIKLPFETNDSEDDRESKLENLTEYVLNFADVTRHLPYDAVGLNYKIAVEAGGLGNLTRGLPDGAQPQKLSFILSYDDFTTKVELDTGTLTDTGTPVVVFGGNFHKDLPEFESRDNRYAEIEQTVQQVPTAFNKLQQIVNATDL